MSLPLSFRRATEADREALWAIIQPIIAGGDTWAFAPDTAKDEMLTFWLSPGVLSYVAEQEGEVVGTFFLKNNQPGLGAHVANAGYMVHPKHEGKGIGRQMGLFSLTEARQLGYRAMQFNIVVKTNERAVRLWQSLGFEIVGELPGAYQHAKLGYVDAYVMYQSLVQPLTFRTATAADADRVALLHAHSWQSAYRGIMPDYYLDHEVEMERTVTWRHRFGEDRPDRIVILAEEAGELVGFVCVVLAEDPVYGALIDNLHARPDQKGRGLGRQLMTLAARWVREQDAHSPIFLWVFEENHAARGFYDRMGGTVAERTEHDHGTVLRYVWNEPEKLG
jgi:GNAT superfamily N-acetyltransferase